MTFWFVVVDVVFFGLIKSLSGMYSYFLFTFNENRHNWCHSFWLNRYCLLLGILVSASVFFIAYLEDIISYKE
jgi:hypothetical protein